MPYRCDEHQDLPADVLVTNLNNGDVAALCGPTCFPNWVDAMHAAFAPAASAAIDPPPGGGVMAAADQLDGGSTVGGDDQGRVDNGQGVPLPPGQDTTPDGLQSSVTDLSGIPGQSDHSAAIAAATAAEAASDHPSEVVAPDGSTVTPAAT